MPFKNSILAAVVVVGSAIGRRIVVDSFAALGAVVQFWYGDDVGAGWVETESNVAQVRLNEDGTFSRFLTITGPNTSIAPNGTVSQGAFARFVGNALGLTKPRAMIGATDPGVSTAQLNITSDTAALAVLPSGGPPGGLGVAVDSVGAVQSIQTGKRVATCEWNSQLPGGGLPINLWATRPNVVSSAGGTVVVNIPAGTFPAGALGGVMITPVSSNTVNAYVSAITGVTSITVAGLPPSAGVHFSVLLIGW